MHFRFDNLVELLQNETDADVILRTVNAIDPTYLERLTFIIGEGMQKDGSHVQHDQYDPWLRTMLMLIIKESGKFQGNPVLRNVAYAIANYDITTGSVPMERIEHSKRLAEQYAERVRAKQKAREKARSEAEKRADVSQLAQQVMKNVKQFIPKKNR